MVDNAKYCIEWTTDVALRQGLWFKYAGPYVSLRRANQAKKDILKFSGSYKFHFRIVHYHIDSYSNDL